MKSYNEMNGTERIAFKNIKGVFEYEVGGWYNCIQDHCEEYIPDTRQEAMQIVYEESLEDRAGQGFYQTGRAPREMRFAGADFIREVIEHLFNTDGDIEDIAEAKNW